MRTNKRAYVHVGIHKTASTFLQKFLLRNKKILFDKGIHLPLLGSDHNFHLHLTGALKFGVDTNRRADIFTNLGQVIKKHSHDTILLSSEVFEDRLSKLNIEFLEHFFSSHGYKAIFIAYVRNQQEYINSRYTQRIKRFWDDCSFDNYVQQANSMEIFDYGRLFSEILGNENASLIVRSFDQATLKGIDADFLDIILGENNYGLDEFEQLTDFQNQAPGPPTIFTAQLARKAILREFPDEKELVEFAHHLARISRKKNWNSSKFVGLSTTDARKIENDFRSKNNAFAQVVWGSKWEKHFTEKQFERNVFVRENATSQVLWEIDSTVDTILNIVRKKNGVGKNLEHYISDVSRCFRKQYRHL